MKTIKVQIIHASADGHAGGNPAGVVLEADTLSNAEKLEIARRVGLSETAFVSQSSTADFKLDFFTPNKQIPHCGHATIATFSYLKQQGEIIGEKSSKETIDGIRAIYFEGDLAFMEQGPPKYIPLSDDDRRLALKSLGIIDDDLLIGFEPAIVNTGNSFLIIPVSHEALLQNMKPDMAGIEKVSANYNLIAFYVYAPSSQQNVDATARMLGPYYGIPEEAATGMAAGPLACYLDRFSGSQDEVVITQGRFMTSPSPSRIMVRLEKKNGVISKLFAGGNAYVARQMVIELD
jgi:PhzF family phenazine biosynthesis protein